MNGRLSSSFSNFHSAPKEWQLVSNAAQQTVGRDRYKKQQAPQLTETFGDLRVVHFRIVLRDLATLQTRPDHEGVHRSFDVVGHGVGRAGGCVLTTGQMVRMMRLVVQVSIRIAEMVNVCVVRQMVRMVTH